MRSNDETEGNSGTTRVGGGEKRDIVVATDCPVGLTNGFRGIFPRPFVGRRHRIASVAEERYFSRIVINMQGNPACHLTRRLTFAPPQSVLHSRLSSMLARHLLFPAKNASLCSIVSTFFTSHYRTRWGGEDSGVEKRETSTSFRVAGSRTLLFLEEQLTAQGYYGH